MRIWVNRVSKQSLSCTDRSTSVFFCPPLTVEFFFPSFFFFCDVHNISHLDSMNYDMTTKHGVNANLIPNTKMNHLTVLSTGRFALRCRTVRDLTIRALSSLRALEWSVSGTRMIRDGRTVFFAEI
jgi:hypothetical protein